MLNLSLCGVPIQGVSVKKLSLTKEKIKVIAMMSCKCLFLQANSLGAGNL